VQDAAGGEVPLINEIKAYRLKGCTQELQEMLGDAFVNRGLGSLHMSVRLLSGAQTEAAVSGAPAAAEGGAPVCVNIEESDVPDEGRNPYIALGWYSLTQDLPHMRVGATLHGGPAGSPADADADARAEAAPNANGACKVVVCLGGGPTCNIEFERACSKSIDSLWYCLYLPPRIPAPGAPAGDAHAAHNHGVTSLSPPGACEGGVLSQPLQSSVNLEHANEAITSIPSEEWRFGGCVYHTQVMRPQ
jgi:hypothetical protein